MDEMHVENVRIRSISIRDNEVLLEIIERSEHTLLCLTKGENILKMTFSCDEWHKFLATLNEIR